MKFPCSRCGQPVARPVWTMWRGRLSRVGADCAEAIKVEKAAGGLGAASTPGKPQRSHTAS